MTELAAGDRVRILFADQLNLARGKYVPSSEARKGHARCVLEPMRLHIAKLLYQLQAAACSMACPTWKRGSMPTICARAGKPAQIALADLHFQGNHFRCAGAARSSARSTAGANGLEPMVGMELEAYIFQRGPNGEWVPYETPGAFVYGTGPFTDPAGLIDDIWAMAARCGLPIRSINAEFDAAVRTDAALCRRAARRGRRVPVPPDGARTADPARLSAVVPAQAFRRRAAADCTSTSASPSIRAATPLPTMSPTANLPG
jgi:glutamine synthetase